MLLVAACAQTALAQNPVNWNVPSGNWDVPGNWDTGNVPDTNFDELANVSNGGTATRKLARQYSARAGRARPAGRRIGHTEHRKRRELNCHDSRRATLPTRPSRSAGRNRSSRRSARRQLKARTLTVGGETGSSVTLGGTTGGTATVTTEFGATFGRNLRVIGPNVNFSTQTLVFQTGEYLRRTNHWGHALAAQIRQFGNA